MRIKNFARFQHFKDRRPPWVKLYRDLLDDPDWHELDAEASKILVMMWLIASEDEEQQGNLPELKKLAFRLRIDQKRLEKLCIKLSHWLEQDDINVISERYQVDAPETETETETDISSTNVLDVRSDAAEPADPVADTKKLPSCPHQKVIDLYHEYLPYCPQVREWNTTRQKYLQSRWREKAVSLGWQKYSEGLEWFKRFFSFVGESKFLTGKVDGRNGKPPFIADLEWLMRPSNFAKVVEGKYHQ